MPSLEQRNRRFRVVFRFAGQKFSRTLKTGNVDDAEASFARLKDNLRRAELGHLVVPEDADVAAFLLSDGRALAKPTIPKTRTLKQLLEAYMASLPEGAIEQSTRQGMDIHITHLKREFGEGLIVAGLGATDLQRYVDTRSLADGIRGRTLSAATIRKELITLKTAWNWARHAGVLKTAFPLKGVKFPKTQEKPPFQTRAEIERQIARGGLSDAEVAELWDCLFLTVPEINELLTHVKRHATKPFVYPMFVFAAHTGARRSEMLRAKISDVDFHSGKITVREKKRDRSRTTTRRLPMSPVLRRVLKAWLREHPGGPFLFCDRIIADGSSVPAAITRDAVHDHFKRTLAGSKWSTMRGWHCLRHSFASNCAAKGIDQRVVNAWMGHAGHGSEIERRYRHLIPNQEQLAITTVFG
ncbi:MAG: tyrosine-type recombinase/integrase [Pirellulales bacterium]